MVLGGAGAYGGDGGQATVELLAILPLLALIAMLLLGFLAGHGAREAADQAAVAAAIAQLQGGDPVAAARAASPGWARTTVVVRGGRVTVRVEPRAPDLVAGEIDAQRSVVFDATGSAR